MGYSTIDQNSDMNNFKETGFFGSLTGTSTATFDHIPAGLTGGFILEVYRLPVANGNSMQTITTFDGGAIYKRVFYAYNSTWTPWLKYTGASNG